MSIHEGTCEFKLSKPVSYTFKGADREAVMVILREPKMEHVKEYTQLKQMLGRAQMEIAERSGQLQKALDAPQAGEEVDEFKNQAESIETESEAREEVFKLALFSSERVDASRFVETFQRMATKVGAASVCVLNGEQPMTGALWSKLHPDDGFNMAVRWCAFFAIASTGAEKSTSEQQPESPIPQTEESVIPMQRV